MADHFRPAIRPLLVPELASTCFREETSLLEARRIRYRLLEQPIDAGSEDGPPA